MPDPLKHESNTLRHVDVDTGRRDVECQAQPTTLGESKTTAFRSLGLLDRYLAIWIFLAMVIGVLLGNFVPSTGPTLQKGKFVGVSIPIAIGLLVMMYPILCKVRFEELHRSFQHRTLWVQIGFSILINWIAAPLLMLGLSWAFLPDEPSLRSGLIIVGIARCIAMVLIWTSLAGGDNDYCAILVSLNSILQMILFAPLATLFIHVIGNDASSGSPSTFYPLIAKSVGVFLGIPLGAAIATRLVLLPLLGSKRYNTLFLPIISPFSLLGLLFTILILFASQGHRVIHQIISVVRVAAPLIVYFTVVFVATFYICNHFFRFGYKLSCTQSFTAASNNFELAIAIAVAVWGVDSDQALAATVGPLIEVPVLLALVEGVKWIGGKRGWNTVG